MAISNRELTHIGFDLLTGPDTDGAAAAPGTRPIFLVSPDGPTRYRIARGAAGMSNHLDPVIALSVTSPLLVDKMLACAR